MRRLFIFATTLVLALSLPMNAFAHGKSTPSPEKARRNELVSKLSKEFDKEKIQKIFSDPRLQLDRSVIAKNAGQYAPSTLLTPESIERGKAFLKEYDFLLGGAERIWKVDREIIAAIIRVETNFGRHLGSRIVLNTLYSIYVLNPKKRDYALKQFIAFLDVAEANEWDLFEIKGSISGAIGLPQFIPTSYSLFAVDANNDKRKDLFDGADAIYSVAYYLAANGWGSRLNEMRNSIYAYNHSWAYVDDVLSYAWALKKPTPVQYWRDSESK